MRRLILTVTIAALAGCSMGHREPTEIKQAINQAINQGNSLADLPASVQADLMPDLEENSGEGDSGLIKRFRIQANAVEARTFFASLVQGTEFSVVVHPDVSGVVTVNLSDVTLDEVLTLLTDLYGYDIVKQGKIVQVYPAGMRSETIPIDYLQLTRSGRSLTAITTSSVSDDNITTDSNASSDNSRSAGSSSSGGTRIETNSDSDFWTQLQSAVSGMIGTDEGRSVVVSPQAGLMMVKAYPNEIREIKQFLAVTRERLQRQVILETKILEVTLSDSYQQGINWSNMSLFDGDITVGRSAGTASLAGMTEIGQLLGGETSITISDGSFSSVLNFMATQGDLNILSSPRVTATNNQKAVIKVGTDNYFVTDVDFNYETIGDESVRVADYEISPFFSGISLDVTPQIDDQGNVLLHVHPAVIDVSERSYEFLDDAPMASSTIRESDSVIRAKDGDVVVIGGLMKSNTVNQVAKVPLLGDIPGLGHLFRNSSDVTQKTELVILLKPTVVGVHTWQQELERSRDMLQELFPESE